MGDSTSPQMHDSSAAGPQVSLRVYHEGQLVFTTNLNEPVEVGRQRGGEPEPYCRIPATGRSRVIVARRREAAVSRQHALIRPQASGAIWVGNVSKTSRITLDSGQFWSRAMAGRSHRRRG